jgi:hypothetical protein
MSIIKFEDIEEKILQIQGKSVLLDSDVARIYNVETRDINKAVKNNPDKFPAGYIIHLTMQEFEDLRWKISTANLAKTRYLPKAFTEKGLYMLATILRGPVATTATLAIIETFTKIRELNKMMRSLSEKKSKHEQLLLIQKSGEIFSDILGEGFSVTEEETSVEINFLCKL